MGSSLKHWECTLLSDSNTDRYYYSSLFEAIAGYGLGGSFVALFGRVGGGIYTKAADRGADLVGRFIIDPSFLDSVYGLTPLIIADNVGENVSADLFGSFSSSTCVALVLSSS